MTKERFGSPKRVRGRIGIWVPGAEFPPLQDLGFQRIPEETEGANLMKRIAIQSPLVRDAMLRMFHVPNGGSRGDTARARAIRGGMMTAQGVRPSVPDYCLPLPRGEFHGFYLELKAGDGTLEKEQRAELERLAADGYCACCAWTAEAAFKALAHYLTLPAP